MNIVSMKTNRAKTRGRGTIEILCYTFFELLAMPKKLSIVVLLSGESTWSILFSQGGIYAR